MAWGELLECICFVPLGRPRRRAMVSSTALRVSHPVVGSGSRGEVQRVRVKSYRGEIKEDCWDSRRMSFQKIGVMKSPAIISFILS